MNRKVRFRSGSSQTCPEPNLPFSRQALCSKVLHGTLPFLPAPAQGRYVSGMKSSRDFGKKHRRCALVAERAVIDRLSHPLFQMFLPMSSLACFSQPSESRLRFRAGCG